jgi:predicted Zn-dependent protease
VIAADTAYLNYYYTQNYSTSKIQGVAAHELGHVAGLDETGACPAVMWHVTNSSCRATVPQTDDINGIDALY